mmetsp:Transcript_21231/g.22016  ORF Transcript_21231/g.22016 Transcript_21231/m.22016 type:complete len:453 (-) Transcript_21231:95-1453(-)
MSKSFKISLASSLKFYKQFSRRFSLVQQIDSYPPEKINSIKQSLISKNYNYFLDESNIRGLDQVVSELKALQSNLSHQKEKKIDRELILRSNEAIEVLSLYNRSVEDHSNFSASINENNIYKVYNTMIKTLPDETSDVNKLILLSSTNNRVIYQNNNSFSNKSYLRFFGKTLATGILIKKFNIEIAILLGKFGPLTLFSGLTYFYYQHLAKSIGSSGNLVKKLVYKNLTKTIEVDYITSICTNGNASFELGELNLQYVSADPNTTTGYYLLYNNTHKFVLPIENSNTLFDRKLLVELFNLRSRDSLVEYALISNKFLINLNCPFTRNPNNTIDTLLREKILSENENIHKLSSEDLQFKLLSIHDNEVEEYREKLLTELRNSEEKNISDIKYILQKVGIEKSSEAASFLIENLNVSSFEHLKNISEFELKTLSKYLSLSAEEEEKLYEKIKNL